MSPGKNKGDKGKEKRKKATLHTGTNFQYFCTVAPLFFCFSFCGSMANKVENPNWKVLEVNNS